MPIPSTVAVLRVLSQLDVKAADDLESQWLEFKPWTGAKDDMRLAAEYAVCFANAEGGVLVFGVADKTRGRAEAIHGVGRYNSDTWRRGIFQGTSPNVSVELEEMAVPEGTGKLLLVRIPKGTNPPYGTTQGLFKQRIGAHCMPLDASMFSRGRVSSGAVDWSGQTVAGLDTAALDPVEMARARSILRSKNPDSELLRLDDAAFLAGLEAVRDGQVTNAGLLLFGRSEVVSVVCPQSQIHYVHQVSDTKVARNDVWRSGLLQSLERIEQVFTSAVNPEEEVSVGLFKLRVPAFPVDAVREAILNAVTHRDYSDPGEILIRHTTRELVVTSPGGFFGGITLDNILRHEPVSRNRTLANAFLKLRLVESAGTGRRRIFVSMLNLGKRAPRYESDGHQVTLHLYDGVIDQHMAALVAKWNQDGRTLDLDGLLALTWLKEHTYIDSRTAADVLQMDRENASRVLDSLSRPGVGILERRGRTKAVSYHLVPDLARDLLGKTAYTRDKGINPARYAAMVKEYLFDHETIANRDIRGLLGLGDSPSAKVDTSRLLARWSSPGGFLVSEGGGKGRRYRLRLTP